MVRKEEKRTKLKPGSYLEMLCCGLKKPLLTSKSSGHHLEMGSVEKTPAWTRHHRHENIPSQPDLSPRSPRSKPAQTLQIKLTFGWQEQSFSTRALCRGETFSLLPAGFSLPAPPSDVGLCGFGPAVVSVVISGVIVQKG